MTITTAIGNQKGGVGKTTVTLCLASELVRLGRTVLILDMDQQRNATTTILGVEPDRDIEDVLVGRRRIPLEEAITTSDWEGICLVPGSATISSLERDPDVGIASRLNEVIIEARKAGALARFDDILIDLPPALNTAAASALITADRVLAVTEPEPLSSAGLEAFLGTFGDVRRGPNPDLRLFGVLANKVRHTKESDFRVGELREAVGDMLLEPLVPARVAAVEVASRMRPLHELKGEGAQVLVEAFQAHAKALVADSMMVKKGAL